MQTGEVRRILKLFMDLLLRPSTIATIEQRVSWAGTGCLIALLTLAAAALLLRLASDVEPGLAPWPVVFSLFAGLVVTVFVSAETLIAALLSLGLRFQRRYLRFSVLFLLSTWASLPSFFLGCVSVGFGSVNWYTRQAGLLLDWIGLLWWAWLMAIALQSRLGMSSAKVWLTLMPSLLALTCLLVLVWSFDPPTVQTATPWRSVAGPHVTLFHSKAPDAKQLSDASDKILSEVVSFLGVEVPQHKLRVFVFEDSFLYKRVTGSQELHGEAHLADKLVTVVRSSSNDMRCTMIHEVTHFVVHERIAESLPGLLHEGIATLAETTIGRCKVDTDLTLFTNGLSLRVLINDTFFYEQTSAYYSYAGAFVSDLIQQQGLPRFKDFCRSLADRSRASLVGDEEQNFLQAFRASYGVELSDWENAWKKNAARRTDVSNSRH